MQANSSAAMTPTTMPMMAPIDSPPPLELPGAVVGVGALRAPVEEDGRRGVVAALEAVDVRVPVRMAAGLEEDVGA